MKSNSPAGKVNFAVLQLRLRAEVVRRIDNGEFTERGFARMLGISQPQIHNVLKGARKLSPELADLIFTRLGLSVLDLITDEERIEGWGEGSGAPRKPPQASGARQRIYSDAI